MICSIEQKQAYKARKELKQFFFVFLRAKAAWRNYGKKRETIRRNVRAI